MAILQFAAEAEFAVSMADRTMVATIATPRLTHDRQIVLPQGMDLTTYRKNPVVMWSHEYYLPPVGTNKWIKKDGANLVAKTEFAERPDSLPKEREWLPDTLLHLYDKNILRGMSVGVMADESHEPTKDELKANKTWNQAWRVIGKSTLLEYSCCSIPMNPGALKQALDSEGLEISQPLLHVLGLDTPVTPTTPAEGEDTLLSTAPGGLGGLDDATLSLELGLTPDEAHAAQIRSPNEFTALRSMSKQFAGKDFKVQWGLLKSSGDKAIQSYHYPMETWTVAEARQHCRDHGGTVFEAATAVTHAVPQPKPAKKAKPVVPKIDVKALAMTIVSGVTKAIPQIVTDEINRAKGRV